MEVGAPRREVRHARIAGEAGDHRGDEDRLELRERRARRRLEAANREPAAAARGIVRREELVHAELGAADVAGAIGEQMAQQAIGKPRQARLARGRPLERDAELVERIVPALVRARRRPVGADGAGREEVRQARMALPCDDERPRELGTARERTRFRGSSAEHDGVATADRLARPVGELPLRPQARALRFRVHDLEQRGMVGAIRRRQRDAEHARVGLEDDTAKARVLGWLVAFERDRHVERAGDVVERRGEGEVVRHLAERRQEDVQPAVADLEADRGAWRIAAVAEALKRQAIAERQRAVEDVEATPPKMPRARPPGVVRGVPFERQHPADRRAGRGCRQRVGGRTPALGIAKVLRRRSRGAHVAPGAVQRVRVGRHERVVGQTERASGRDAGVARRRVVDDPGAEQARRDRDAVSPPDADEPPARRGLARIPGAASAVHDAARREARVQLPEQALGGAELPRAERNGGPLGPIAVGGGDDGDRAPDRERDAARREIGVDGRAERANGRALRVAKRPGRRYRREHLGRERLALVDLQAVGLARDGRGARRIGRAGEREIALVGEDARARIEADPAGARNVDLAPRVQARVGVGVVGDDAVAAREARREAEGTKAHREEPCHLSRRARPSREHRFEIDGGASRVLAADLGGDCARHGVDALDDVARRAHETGEPLRESRPGVGGLEVRRELLRELRLVRERMRRRAGLDQELERIHGHEVRHERDLDVERRHRLGQVEAREVVLEGVAEPIQKMRLGAHVKRVRRDGRVGVRGGAEA